ncbi:hypothetical protein BOO69_12610 [Sulfitobacter alexandrii]|uniref:Uncharacterized protein n=1 Tax=Sulfitobacter alexandrii TaxID=1917485 RepID=A0A1J0WIK0_9RHOB|nr:hypothetical protein [Sulfitobacter alexandrii]APE44148.1 hypothetical protein BOO69_12610 [Sulfitobacter alexandrii]
MSDPVTNAEVEDVLSSIRRLVSEDKRPMQPKAKPVMSDRLVLTPALRVADTEPSEPAQETPEATVQDWSEEDAAFEAAYGDEDMQEEDSHQAMARGVMSRPPTRWRIPPSTMNRTPTTLPMIPTKMAKAV